MPPSWGVLLGTREPLSMRARQRAGGWLSDSEQRRLADMDDVRKAMFLACRHGLRMLLADSSAPAAKWRLSSPSGRAPRVERGQGGGARWSARPMLSVSHSGNWLACAKAPVAMGIDMEVLAPSARRDVRAMAELVCSPAECRWLEGMAGDERQQAFIQLWCLKEAYVKCLGTGLDLALMRRMECKKAPACVMGGINPPRATRAAHARLWHGRADDGAYVCLACCSKQQVPPILLSFASTLPLVSWNEDMLWELDWTV